MPDSACAASTSGTCARTAGACHSAIGSTPASSGSEVVPSSTTVAFAAPAPRRAPPPSTRHCAPSASSPAASHIPLARKRSSCITLRSTPLCTTKALHSATGKYTGNTACHHHRNASRDAAKLTCACHANPPAKPIAPTANQNRRGMGTIGLTSFFMNICRKERHPCVKAFPNTH